MQVNPDETLTEFEERVKRYSNSETPLEDFLEDGFMKGSPNDRQKWLVDFDRLVFDEARPTRDFARWETLRREFSARDALLRRVGR